MSKFLGINSGRRYNMDATRHYFMSHKRYLVDKASPAEAIRAIRRSYSLTTTFVTYEWVSSPILPIKNRNVRRANVFIQLDSNRKIPSNKQR
ncbi:unnamed protein product, partial [Allacma fusca]